MKRLRTPLEQGQIESLKAGTLILLSGIIYTARDQAHKRLVALIGNKKPLPFKLKNSTIYYCGPTATPEGKIIGSCGPTTSCRMDDLTEPLLKEGVKGFIGKGRRSDKVRGYIGKYKAVYFLAPSGCGALLAEKVIKKKKIAFKDLGPEAVYKLEVKDFPLIVGIDAQGRDVYG